MPSNSARFVRSASLVSIIIGTAVFVSWVLGFDALKSVTTGTSTMKANTSLMFALAGAALWLAGGGHDRRLIRALAAVVVGAAVVTLAEYVLGRSLGLDEVIVSDHAPVPLTAPPGRMGINTATDHNGTADGNPVHIFISDVAVKVTGSDNWINAQ